MNSTTGPPLDPKTDSPFGFIPTLWVCALFICLYSATTAVHLFQSLWYRPRVWWWIPTVFICGIAEIIGWAGRLWGSRNPWAMNPYLMQICCTIFAPSFMTAAMFIIFVRIIILVGPEYSRLSPKLYSYLLVGVDLVALIIQAVGGSQAASANTPQGASKGARVMVGGIILQMVAITAYALASIEYFWRVSTDRPLRLASGSSTATSPQPKQSYESSRVSTTPLSEKPTVPSGRPRMTGCVKQMVAGLAIATVLVYIRSIYRTIELLDGWGGPIITNQILFDVLDGVPIVLAMVTLNVFHPGRLIPTITPRLEPQFAMT